MLNGASIEISAVLYFLFNVKIEKYRGRNHL